MARNYFKPKTYSELKAFRQSDVKQKIKEIGHCEKCFSSYFLLGHHIVPVKNGGSNHPDNMIILCKSCHSIAHSKEISEAQKKRYGNNPHKKNLINFNCLYCGKDFQDFPSTKRKFCSRVCHNLYMTKI
jgi:5-methylcytosine-specific restriction endonuclease McrA